MSSEASVREFHRNLPDLQGCCWGKELHGLNLNSHLSSAQIDEVKSAVDEHRLVILPNQVLLFAPSSGLCHTGVN